MIPIKPTAEEYSRAVENQKTMNRIAEFDDEKIEKNQCGVKDGRRYVVEGKSFLSKLWDIFLKFIGLRSDNKELTEVDFDKDKTKKMKNDKKNDKEE